MYITKPVKIFVGIASLLVFLLPVIFISFWVFMVFSMSSAANLASNEFPANEFPFNSFDAIYNFIVPVVCLLNISIYALVGFFVYHAIKNNNVSDAIRTIAILAFFLFPFLGIPFYYILFILLPEPPSWTIKKQSTLAS